MSYPAEHAEALTCRKTQTVEEMDAVDVPGEEGRGRLFQLHPFVAGRDPFELGGAGRADSLSVGRASDCDLSLADSKVSRGHAEIARCGRSFLLSDRGSTNGTLVNGRPVDVHLLVSGDRIRFGNHVFKYLDVHDPENAYHLVVEDRIARDPLTGAFNRAYFDQELLHAVSPGRPVSVISLDVDHFKAVNDTHGHAVGDEVLKETVRRLTERLIDGAALCRVGGEEFCVILVGDGDPAKPLELAESMRQCVCDSPFVTDAGKLSVSVSVGLSRGVGFAEGNPVTLLQEADQALYAAKHAGRNCVREA